MKYCNEIKKFNNIIDLFLKFYYEWLLDNNKILKICDCSGNKEICNICNGVGLVINHINKNNNKQIPLELDINFSGLNNIKNFENKYNYYLLYEFFYSNMEKNPKIYISLCKTCNLKGEINKNWKDRSIITIPCPFCRGSLFSIYEGE